MRIHEQEEGQALLLALAFLLFAALVIGSVLSFAHAGLLASQRLRSQRAAVYAADGALESAIQLGRIEQGVGAYGSSPCTVTPKLTLTDPTSVPGEVTQATVYCTFLHDVGQDRVVEFRACVGNEVVAVATVRYYDYAYSLNPNGRGPAVEIRSWVSRGATGECRDGWPRA
jgi:hypothetical protein